jgi:hypothetical protein
VPIENTGEPDTAPDGGRITVFRDFLPHVIFAEILAAVKQETGAVIRPFHAGKVSLERQRACTLVTLDP